MLLEFIVLSVGFSGMEIIIRVLFGNRIKINIKCSNGSFKRIRMGSWGIVVVEAKIFGSIDLALPSLSSLLAAMAE